MAWAAVLAAGISAAGSAYASKQARKKGRTQKEMERLMAENARLSGEYGTKFLDRSSQALDPVYNYYRTLASGDRTATASLFGQDIEDVTRGSQQAYQTGMELAPRSGMGTESNSRIALQNAAAIARILRGGRPAGIEGLARLGTNWGTLGMSALNQSGSAAGGVLDFNNQHNANARNAGRDAGDAAYNLFKLISDAAAQNRTNNTQTPNFWSGAGNAGSTARKAGW